MTQYNPLEQGHAMMDIHCSIIVMGKIVIKIVILLKRLVIFKIEALRLSYNSISISKLCPVTTLTEYPNKTSQVTNRNYLINPPNQKINIILQESLKEIS